MAGQGGVSGTAVFVVLAGSVLAYSGIKGVGVSTIVHGFLSGQSPSTFAPTLTAAVTGSTNAGSPAAPGSAIAAGSTNQTANVSLLAQTLARLGLNQAGQAAFLGNFQTESGFDPNAYNANEGAVGFAQWEKGRFTALQSYAQSTGGSVYSANTQAGFLAQELTGPYAGVLAQVKAVTAGNNTESGAQQGASIVQSQYEGSTPDSLGARMANAAGIFVHNFSRLVA